MQTRHLAPRRRAYNALLPIGQLPNEILAWILGFASRDLPIYPIRKRKRELVLDSHVERLHVLAQVSWRWAGVIKTFPELWATLDTECTTDERSLILKKSKGASLEIIHRESIHQRRNDRCITDLKNHLHRCVAIQIMTYRLGHLFGLLGPEVQWSRLNRITIEATSVEEAEALEVNLAVAAPALRHVTLRHMTLPWGECHFDGLESFDLELRTWGQLTPDLTSPPLEWILAVLRASPSLKSLKLRITWADINQQVTEDYTAIPLPSLRHLYLGCHTFYTLKLLTLLEIPSCTDMTLRIAKELPATPSMASAPYMASLLNSAGRAKLSVHLQDNAISRVTWQYWEKKEESCDDCPREIHLDEKVVPENIFQLLPLSDPRLFHVDFVEGEDFPNSKIPLLILPIMEQTHCVTSLNLVNINRVHSYLPYLSQPTREGHQERWLLPNLQHISIDCYDIHRRPVVAFVRARTVDREDGGGNSHGHRPPAMLESIKFVSCLADKKLERMLHDAAPNLTVSWEPAK